MPRRLLDGPKAGFVFYTLLLRLHLSKIWIRRALRDVSSRRGTSYTLNCNQHNEYHRYLPYGAKWPVMYVLTATSNIRHAGKISINWKKEMKFVTLSTSWLRQRHRYLRRVSMDRGFESYFWFYGTPAFFFCVVLIQCKACNGQTLRRKSPTVCLQTGTRDPVKQWSLKSYYTLILSTSGYITFQINRTSASSRHIIHLTAHGLWLPPFSFHQARAGQLFEEVCRNCLQIWKKSFRVTMIILKTKIRYCNIPKFLLITALLLTHIIINA